MREITISFGEMFDIISKKENILFKENKEYFQKTNIEIQNEEGKWCSVNGLITKKDKLRIIEWSDGTITKCADKHWICFDGKNCRLASDFEYGDEILKTNGITYFCKKNTLIDEETIFYDMQIDCPSHLYQTADGVIHHNTLLAQTIARMLNVPFAMADATSLTEAGYVGEDVESVLARLLSAANNDVSKAETGIIFLDEIDKKRANGSSSNNRDVSGEGVQQALLKLLEGAEIMVPPAGTKKTSNAEMVKINTRNILFIVGGAFVGLDKLVEKAQNKNAGIGFSSSVDKVTVENPMTLVEPEHLMQFGLIPELIGRLPIIAPLQDLDEEQLVRVLTEPKHALIKQIIALFRVEGIELEFEKDALLAIAKIAKKRKTNGRALRSVVETSMLKTQFKLPELRKEGVCKIIITATCINEGVEPLYYKKDENVTEVLN